MAIKPIKQEQIPLIGFAVLVLIVILIGAAFFFTSKPPSELVEPTIAPTLTPTAVPTVIPPTSTEIPTITPVVTITPTKKVDPTIVPAPTTTCSGFEACGLIDGCCPTDEVCDAVLDIDCTLYVFGDEVVTFGSFIVSLDSVETFSCEDPEKEYLRATFSVENGDEVKHFFASSNLRIYDFKTGNYAAASLGTCSSSTDRFQTGDLQPGESRSGAAYFVFREDHIQDGKIRVGFLIGGANFYNVRRNVFVLNSPK